MPCFSIAERSMLSPPRKKAARMSSIFTEGIARLGDDQMSRRPA